MSKVRFVASIRVFNGNPFVYVSTARVRTIKPGWRKPLPVLVRINSRPREKPWRINMMPIGTGAFYLYLHGDIRGASRTKVGDRVRVEVQFDATYRNGPLHPMPSWFRVPLSKDAKATKAWGALITSRKKEILRYFARRARSQCDACFARAIGRAGSLHGAVVVNRPGHALRDGKRAG